jgi:hypothetical protein
VLYKSYAALLAVALVCQVVRAQDKSSAPKTPPPRFITLRTVDQAKGEVVFDVQVVAQMFDERTTLLVFPDGHKQMTLGRKPAYVQLGEGFTVSLKKAKWSGTDGKEVSADAAVKRLNPGVMVLLSADGAAVDRAYLSLFKEDTLVLVVAAEELPVPYIPQSSGAIPVKAVGKR